MLVGGIAFELPPNIQDDKPAKANTLFTLYVNKAIALSEEHGIMVHYTLYFDESVRGLEVGAPVTLHGLSIGQVTAVRLENTTISGDIRPRVDIALYPERFLKHAQLSRSADDQTRNREACNAFLRHKISGGLRAQLRSGNIFLAQRFIALDFFPKSLAPGVNWSSERPQLPVVSSGLVDLETKVNLILAQMGKIPFQEIGDELKATLVSLNLAANRLEKDILPEARTTMEDLRHAIATADNLLKSSEQTMFGPNAPVQQEMREALQEISRAARAVGIFSEYLQQNPNALIRGKSAESP
jgi:paraquat-inducible protein B